MLTVDDTERKIPEGTKDFSELTQTQQIAMLRAIVVFLAGKGGRPELGDIDLMFPGFIPRG